MQTSVKTIGTGVEEEHIIVNNDRSITIPKDLRNIAVQYDHNIETVRFDCPRYWDGHDLSEMIVSINYIRFDGHEGTYLCKNITVDNESPDIFHFDWTISRDVTSAAGRLTFSVCIKRSHVDGMTSQVWHSQICETVSILKGLECDQTHIPSDPEYNGIQADYEQYDTSAADYIKNRPFYKKSEIYTFPNADYTTPVYDIPEAGAKLYKISEEFVKIDTFEGSTITYRLGEDEPIVEKVTLDKPHTPEQEGICHEERDEQTNELLAAMISDINGYPLFMFTYVDMPLTDTVIVKSGVYSMVLTEPGEDITAPVPMLDKIEVVTAFKQIDEDLIPPLDDKVISFSRLNIPDMRGFFSNKKFIRPAVDVISSEEFSTTFYGCTNMIESCAISEYPYKPIYISSMFELCENLRRIKGSLDLYNSKSNFSAFKGCKKLSRIDNIRNVHSSISFADSPLDKETVNRVLNALISKYSFNETLTLKSDIVDGLTDEQLASIPSNWTIQ